MATLPTPPGSRTWDCCPVCAATRTTPFVAFTALAFVRCEACGTVFKRFEAPRPKGQDLRSQAPGRHDGLRVRRARAWLRNALQFADVRTALTVGGASGYLLEAGRRLGLRIAGACECPLLAQACREKGHRVEVAPLDRLPFDTGEFELVALHQVLEQTPAPQEVLHEVRRISSDRALLVVAVPNLEYWKALARRWTYRYFRPEGDGHQRFVYFTQSSLEQLLRGSGYEVVSRGKAVYGSREAERSLVRRAWEAARFGALSFGYWLVRALRLQRELFVIAVKAP